MAIELTYEPASPAAGDALYFDVNGSSDEKMAIVITADGDEEQRSTVFGIEDAPEGTGSDRFTLSILGGTFGTFTLEVYEYGAADPVYTSETDPIYYATDPSYTYPTADDVQEALEAALDGLSVDVTKDAEVMTILLGGKYSGRNMGMGADFAGIAGSETASIADASQQTGPFRWGPVVLAADDYAADVVIVGGDNDGDSALDDPVYFTVSA